MTREHPTPDLLDHYLINDLSEPENAELERHVFACESCFSRVASRELESMALAKACGMLARLENDGTRVLTLSTLEPEFRSEIIAPVIPSWRFQPQYAVFAATAAMAVITIGSIGSLERKMAPPAIPLVSTSGAANGQTIQPLDDSLLTSTQEAIPATPKRKAPVVRKPEYIVQARYVRPFLPPDGDVEAPEFDMTQVPPPVYAARRLDTPAIMRLPDAPKRRVRKSRKVLRALATPFKKIGGAFAMLATGRADGLGD